MRTIRVPAVFLLGVSLVMGFAVGVGRANTIQLSIIQADAQLQQNLRGTLQEMRELGATQIRYPVRWYAIAPNPHALHAPKHFVGSNPASYPAGNWAFDDSLVEQAQADGMSVDFLLTGPAPRWEEGPGEPKGGVFGVWEPNAAAFGAFVRAVGTRYSGNYEPPGAKAPLPRVNFWGIWNEPNFGQDLAPQATDDDALELSPGSYRALLSHAWNALQASGHANDTILIGETAPHGHPHPIGNFDLIAPLRFIQVLYCLTPAYQPFTGLAAVERGCPATAATRQFRAENPALFNATGFAIHPYAAGVPPDQSQPGSIKGAADLAAIPEVEQTLDAVFRAYGDHRKIPIYNTEYGYQVGGKVTAADEAYYINWAEYISYKNPRIKSYAQYLLDDPADNGFETGLYDAAGRPKPALNAYRLPLYMPVTTIDRPRLLEVWGGVRPAYFATLDTGLTQHAELQFRRHGSRIWATIKTITITNKRGYFDIYTTFAGTGTLRLTWTDPQDDTYHSRLIAVTVKSHLGY